MSDSTISLSANTAALMQALDSVLEQMGEQKDAVFQVNSNFKFNAHNSLEDCKATREVWHYLLENSGDFADQKDIFMEKVELLNTKNKKYYFVIPEAKNDEALRNEIKEYGAYWETKKQAWVLFCRENDEIPEFFNKFQQLKARELPNYTKKYLDLRAYVWVKILAPCSTNPVPMRLSDRHSLCSEAVWLF